MLVHLHVKNLALIQEAEVDFTNGLNILTGETGAGKSILMDSVNLALGGKMSREMIREHAPFALVELIFETKNEALLKTLKDWDIFPEDGQIIISRKMTDGRSISKINGETCTLAQMKEIAAELLDIYGQQEHQSLLSAKKQLDILDQFGKAEIQEQKQKVKEQFQVYNHLKEELSSYEMGEEQRQRELNFLEFEIQEITEAQLIPGEDAQLEKQYKKLVNGRKIAEGLQEVYQCTGYSGGGEQISRALTQMMKIQEYDEDLANFGQTLTDIDSLLNDFNRELSSYMSDLTFSEEEFVQTENRLNQLNHIKSKYGKTIEDVLFSCQEKEKEQQRLYYFAENREKLQKEVQAAEELLQSASERLSQLRQKQAVLFSQKVRENLADLNFLNTEFSVKFLKKEHYTEEGYDTVEFCISTNPGEAARPLAKVVSGGELSRIMLAVKTLLADKDETETLIFDEIDAGISGRTAQKVSEKMAVIGMHHQVLCITHLPQIAAMADRHFLIEKRVENQETHTSIQRLDEETMILELARMLGGAKITPAVLDNAREMKELAHHQKSARVK
ncbi:MAG: DNA repair protein RecN [Lachnospiraceae bacterium]|jgi:DNA repair protein RecN (Recombination protein N)